MNSEVCAQKAGALDRYSLEVCQSSYLAKSSLPTYEVENTWNHHFITYLHASASSA